jgi:hypothetical protein
MTEALLGVYPDVFMAGVSYMGVPAGCWAEGYNDVQGTPASGTGQWSGPCAGGNVTKSGEEWGNLVRSFFPAHAGHRPRLQHWHGTDDTIIRFANLAEDVKQWTDVLGLSETPSGADTPSNGTTRQYWVNACGYTVYEAFSLAGVGHSVPFDGDAVATYFGLGDPDGPDPEAAACPDTAPESPSGMGGASGSGGAASSAEGTSGGAPAGGSDGTLGTVTPPSDGEATAGDSSPPATPSPEPGAVDESGALDSDELDAPAVSPPGLNTNGAMSSGGGSCSLPAGARSFGAGGAALLFAALGLLGHRRRRPRA